MTLLSSPPNVGDNVMWRDPKGQWHRVTVSGFPYSQLGVYVHPPGNNFEFEVADWRTLGVYRSAFDVIAEDDVAYSRMADAAGIEPGGAA